MSLRNQLLNMGLVSEKQVKKAEKDVRKEQRKQQNHPQGDATPSDAQRARSEKLARDQELNREKAALAKQKEITAQIRQLILAHRVALPDGDMEGEIPYHFSDSSRVKRLMVTSDLRDQIAAGRLAIVRRDGEYDLVPAEVAEKIRLRDASFVVLFHRADTKSPDAPYADHPIPDDLVW